MYARRSKTYIVDSFSTWQVRAEEEGSTGTRTRGARTRIEVSKFAVSGDRAVVLSLYDAYVKAVGDAIRKAAEGTKGRHKGKRNAAGEAEGHGTCKFADGDVYTGEWAKDEMVCA